MTRGLRTALWGPSSLAVLWTASALVTTGMMGGGMMWPMPTMGLALVVMLGLDAGFVYLVVTALRGRGGGHSSAPTAPTPSGA